MRTILLVGVLVVSVGYADEKAQAVIYPSSSLKWVDGPPSLPPGAKVAVLEGDPSKPGPFVMRARLPDGYKIPPHTHPHMIRPRQHPVRRIKILPPDLRNVQLHPRMRRIR